MITRSIPMSSPEARTPQANAARDKELDGHRKRGTWDLEAVGEYYNLMNDPKGEEAMAGRGFGILGLKNAELTPAEMIWKYRAVFQGSDIRTKPESSAVELFQDISNALASSTAVRTLLAIAVLLGFEVTVRDALQAYLQARMDGNDRTQTWIELPKEWWPDEWFYDGAKRQQPKFKRPAVLQRSALYGHPESGPVWDNVLSTALVAANWTKVPEWPWIWRHAGWSLLFAYVDELFLACKRGMAAIHWKALDKAIEFKDAPEPIGQFIGAQYKLDEYDIKNRNATRGLSIDMCGYMRKMTEKFAADATTKKIALKCVKTPHMGSSAYSKADEIPVVFANTCASHAATALFVSRVGRPDICVATQRLCSAVSKRKKLMTKDLSGEWDMPSETKTKCCMENCHQET